MDQKQLYELQVSNKKENFNNQNIKNLINGRDKFIIEYLQNLENRKKELEIAELSIGDGSLARELLNSLNIELTGVDISPTRIAEVKKLIEDTVLEPQRKVRFCECNFDTQFNELDPDLFDVVIALDIMEHVFDVFGFVGNCHRILKQEGTLIIRVPNVAYIKHRVGLFFGNLPITASWFGNKGDLSVWRDRWGWDGGHLHYFTIPLLYQLLTQSGFQIELCRDPGTQFSTFRNLLPELLYSNPLIIAKK